MKDNSKTIVPTLLILIYIMIWFCIGFAAFLMYDFAIFSCYEDLYGSWSIWFGIAITSLIFLSPVFLHKFTKNKVKTIKTSFFISGIFIMVVVISYMFTIFQFYDFTPKKWEQYPRQRIVMLKDLEQRHNVIGMIDKEIMAILGQPDEVERKEIYRYYYEFGYIDFIFFNGKVDSIDVTDYF